MGVYRSHRCRSLITTFATRPSSSSLLSLPRHDDTQDMNTKLTTKKQNHTSRSKDDSSNNKKVVRCYYQVLVIVNLHVKKGLYRSRRRYYSLLDYIIIVAVVVNHHHGQIDITQGTPCLVLRPGRDTFLVKDMPTGCECDQGFPLCIVP